MAIISAVDLGEVREVVKAALFCRFAHVAAFRGQQPAGKVAPHPIDVGSHRLAGGLLENMAEIVFAQAHRLAKMIQRDRLAEFLVNDGNGLSHGVQMMIFEKRNGGCGLVLMTSIQSRQKLGEKCQNHWFVIRGMTTHFLGNAAH